MFEAYCQFLVWTERDCPELLGHDRILPESMIEMEEFQVFLLIRR